MWYEVAPTEKESMKRVLMERFQSRYQALMLLRLNHVDFLRHFNQYFSLDNPKLCDTLLSENRFFRIQEMARGAVGIVSRVTLLSHDLVVVLKEIPVTAQPSFLPLNVYSMTDAHEVMNPALKRRLMITKKGDPKLIAVSCPDSFTNQTIQHCILNLILEDTPQYIYQYDAFWCGPKGYNITELAHLGTLHSHMSHYYSRDGLHEATRQLLSVMSRLKSDDYGFVHADLKGKNVFVSGSTESPIYKIADFDKSSISWHGFRFYNASLDYRLSNEPPQVVDGYYQALSSLLPLQVYTMHNPFGYYMSYDIYTLFLSYLAVPQVWNDVYRCYTLGEKGFLFYDVFKSMWKANDFAKLMTWASTHYESLVKISHINAMLHKLQLWLKVDISDVYRSFHVPPPVIHDEVISQTITLSQGDHLCLSPCQNQKCDVMPYKGWTGTYTYDTCK